MFRWKKALAALRRKVVLTLTHVPGLSTWAVKCLLARRYARHFGRAPDLRRPRLFTEHILHRIVYDRDPLLKIASDKVAVRGWIDGVLGPGYTVPLLGTWHSADQIDWMSLPIPFIVKPAHSSGPFRIVDRPLDEAHIQELTTAVAQWVDEDFFHTSFEWGYRGLRRRVTAEPLLRAPDGGRLVEVDVFTFHGQPRVLLAFTGHKHSETDRCAIWVEESGSRSHMWGSTALAEEVLDSAGVKRMEDQIEAARPGMIELSRRIGEHFPYVRVDFYITDTGLKIGELTTYPAAGLGIYHPDDADARLGRMLRDSGLQRRDRGLAPFAWPPLD
jgi:hypothetical protein